MGGPHVFCNYTIRFLGPVREGRRISHTKDGSYFFTYIRRVPRADRYAPILGSMTCCGATGCPSEILSALHFLGPGSCLCLCPNEYERSPRPEERRYLEVIRRR
jgi:hypothetical protein